MYVKSLLEYLTHQVHYKYSYFFIDLNSITFRYSLIKQKSFLHIITVVKQISKRNTIGLLAIKLGALSNLNFLF